MPVIDLSLKKKNAALPTGLTKPIELPLVHLRSWLREQFETYPSNARSSSHLAKSKH
jgi:hypothetical protein